VGKRRPVVVHLRVGECAQHTLREYLLDEEVLLQQHSSRTDRARPLHRADLDRHGPDPTSRLGLSLVDRRMPRSFLRQRSRPDRITFVLHELVGARLDGDAHEQVRDLRRVDEAIALGLDAHADEIGPRGARPSRHFTGG